ncbi:P-loop containing nucleoside triphosphate hydrolase protein [Plectosphaerella plurivora]|uniref:P-loop containing nucleoside triphosphate hydrolase protein n=1 Tax=Plectosphaerella plurivora TaxID=936078 RepID=A0A9P9A9B6_9PEZI|nr:P-loop containing nucleoside triphosphate hydrolase protein [Plectosphaerella plurivora]
MAQAPNPPEAVVDLDALGELNTPEARAIFDMIDKLSALGVGKIVDLPQIIVVGDQSAGKSTVLGAISQIHFPVQAGLCTRFATELVLSPSHDRRVQALVRFAESSKEDHTLTVDDFDQKGIQQIVGTAKEQMGLSEKSRDYSKDVLRLELGSPDMCHLTLVDLPGIYHNYTDDQSTEGIAAVLDIVTSYMKKPNSIILAIISASGEFANQAVMREAAKYDPARERTLGVITKPDLLPPSSDQQRDYLQLVRNAQKTHKLKLGWHVVRNRADYEDRPANVIEDEFFRTGPWSSIPESGRGIVALRKRLSKLLYEHIKKSLPTVFSNIQLQLAVRQDELSRLGKPRPTPEAMKQYLTTTAERFRDLILAGMRGQYDDSFFMRSGEDGDNDDEENIEEEDVRKLRAQLRNWNRRIRYTLLRFGSAYEIVDAGGASDLSSRLKTLPHYLTDSTIEDDRPLKASEPVSRAYLAKKLESRAAMNQGVELPGFPNMGLATQLFQKQIRPWEKLAVQHLENVMSYVRDFVDQVVLEVTGPSNERIRNALLSVHVEPFFDAKQDVLAAELQKILRPYKESFALALDADFLDAMHEKTTRRRSANVGNAVTTLTAAEQVHVPEFGAEQIVDTVQTFYDMSLRTFTDNLITLVIESCLIQDLPGIFNPSTMSTMDEEQLSSFAAEEEGVTNYRSQLQTEIALLKEGLELARRNMPRYPKGRARRRCRTTTPLIRAARTSLTPTEL